MQSLNARSNTIGSQAGAAAFSIMADRHFTIFKYHWFDFDAILRRHSLLMPIVEPAEKEEEEARSVPTPRRHHSNPRSTSATVLYVYRDDHKD